jgi:spore coat protein U-like protein
MSNTMQRAVLALLTLLVLLPAPAMAACSITLRNVTAANFTSSQAYPIFNAAETAATLSFQVRHPNGQAACNYFVTFSRGGSATYNRRMATGANQLQYQLYPTSAKAAVLKAIPDAVAGEVITGTFSTTALVTHDLSYYIALPPQQVVVPGLYTDSVVVRLYEGTLSSYTQRDSVTLSMKARVVATTEMCVACTSAFDNTMHSHELNFGTLETGESKSATVRVRTNEGYTLKLQSQNRSYLKHTTLNSTVRYTVEVGGVPVDLTPNAAQTACHVPGVTAAQGTAYDVRVIIGSVSGALAGNYSDAITLTVTAY